MMRIGNTGMTITDDNRTLAADMNGDAVAQVRNNMIAPDHKDGFQADIKPETVKDRAE